MSIDGGLTWVDADTVTGPYLNGATVAPQFKFVVTNTGNVPLSNVTVTDSDFTLPAGCIVTSLAVGASDDCIITAAWAAGQHTNTATASGSFTDGNGNTETDTDTDNANYYGSNPEIDVEKYVSIDGGLTLGGCGHRDRPVPERCDGGAAIQVRGDQHRQRAAEQRDGDGQRLHACRRAAS